MASVRRLEAPQGGGAGRDRPGAPRANGAGLGIGIGQLIRFGWFTANYQLAARRIKPLDRPVPVPEGMPDRATMIAALFALLREDRANVRAGVYPPPADAVPAPAQWLRQARTFFADLPKVDARRRSDLGPQDVKVAPPPGLAGLDALPAYYTQNFHFQTDGYLSAESASIYDYQVDVLFSGGADAMRRLCLPPLVDALGRRGLRAPVLLDLACGTARTLGFLKQRWPAARALGIDLSPPYLAVGRANLADLGRTHLICANGERLPLADASVDAVACVFTFHELPPAVRRVFAAEIARVLRPGGRFVLVDSLQTGDNPAFDPLLEFFPRFYHEPYFDSYRTADLPALCAEAGLVPAGDHVRFLARRTVADKPG